MGGKNESEVKSMIRNEISNEINNKTVNISTVVNSSVTSVTQSIKQKAEAEVSTSTVISNVSNLKGITIKGPGSVVDLSQDAKGKVVNEAIIKIISDASELKKMGNDISDKIKNNLDSNQAAKQDLESLSKIGEFNKKSGGPEGMVDTLATMVSGMLSNITGTSSSNTSTTEIINSIKSTINNETINQNEINNTINTSVSSMMEQMAQAKCNITTTGKNEFNFENIDVLDGGVLKQAQTLNIEAFNKCIIDLNLGSKISTNLTNGFQTDLSNSLTSGQTTDQKSINTADITKTNEDGSAIMNSVDNLVDTAGSVVTSVTGMGMFVIGGIILFLFIVFAIIIAGGSKGSSSEEYNDSDEKGGQRDSDERDGQRESDERRGRDDSEELTGGGMNGNIYLIASFVSMLILIANKSLPLCGVLLVIIILYFVYKKNPKFLDL